MLKTLEIVNLSDTGFPFILNLSELLSDVFFLPIISFVSIGHNLAQDIICNVNPLIYVNSVNDSIVIQHVSVAQVRNVFTSLKDSSPG